MDQTRSYVEYVLQSGARTDVLLAISGGCDSTPALLGRELASESAVYNALSELDESGLIQATGPKCWKTTGIGAVVADLIERQRETDRTLRSNPAYWQNHDVTALPPRFRDRFAALSDGEVIEATETQPTRVVREVERRIRSADAAAVIAPIYHDRYADALLSVDDGSRLILERSVFEDLQRSGDGPDDLGDLEVRIAEASFALAVTDECLLLSLPKLDGSYDERTEFVAQSTRARRWGERVFEHCWSDGVELEDYDPSL